MFELSEKKSNSISLQIWDVEGLPPVSDMVSVRWRGFVSGAQPDDVSIPELIEANADVLRKRYLAWIFDLGEKVIQGKRLVEYLELRPGFSYWWMTLFAEKCNYSKSMQINDAIRLMALDEWAKNRSVSRVVLTTNNQMLAECMRLWCDNLGVAFDLRRIAKLRASLPWEKRIYKVCPHAMRSMIWLGKHIINRWPLIGVGLKGWQQSKGRITFFSYLFNLAPDATKQGRYESRYWAHLPDALMQVNCKTNWLHLYVDDALLPTSKQAAETLRSFNKVEVGEQSHVTLDTFLSFSVVMRTIQDWIHLIWVSVKLRKKINTKQLSPLNLWPLFEDDWRQSMFGTIAISNLLNLNLFEAALKHLPKQQRGVYLQENQGWEFALIQSWQAAGHGHLIGAQHSTVRYWDLRYFFDPRSYRRTGGYDLPMPNQFAFNGLAVKDAYKNGGYPAGNLVEVEALRYMYLSDVQVKTTAVQKPKNSPIRLLVLGDYLCSNTQQQMNLLAQASTLLPKDIVITVKPHPACPIQPEDYLSLTMTVTMEHIGKLLAECDVAYTSAVTSAVVDAYCAGIPVISVLDPNALNLSPLRGCAGALFASTPEELATKLMLAVSPPGVPSSQIDFFTTDPQLPRWKKLLLGNI
jgi:surface carbohydrate biosynthesis protein (TIGR04326 family)